MKNQVILHDSAETPVVGVTQLNRLQDWVNDEIDQGIDLAWESVLEDVRAEVTAEFQDEATQAKLFEKYQYTIDDSADEAGIAIAIEEETEERSQDWDPDADSASVLIGDWVKNAAGQYMPDPNGPQGFAAHYTGFCGGVISVEWSRWVKRCHQTSPCFVMADGRGTCGDLDTTGDMRLAYSLPPDWYAAETDEGETDA